jgi:choline-glycine betaine transporter
MAGIRNVSSVFFIIYLAVSKYHNLKIGQNCN